MREWAVGSKVRYGAERGGTVTSVLADGRYAVKFSSRTGTLKGSSLRADIVPENPMNGIPEQLVPANPYPITTEREDA